MTPLRVIMARGTNDRTPSARSDVEQTVGYEDYMMHGLANPRM
jgi:hypothetical protein